MTLQGINVHPVKSTAIRPVRESSVLARGLADDRSWMVVDSDGVLVSARELHGLFHVVADTPRTDPEVSHDLRLRCAGHPELTLDAPTTEERVPVRLFRHDLRAVPAGVEADDWLRSALGRPDLRLVWCDDPTRRALNPEYSRPGDHTAFADGYPVTVASLASLAQLNEWIAQACEERGEPEPEPLPIQRFRPSLVVDGEEPFAEDRWTSLRVGDVELEVAKPVGRCVMTTIDPQSLATAKEPLRTLARHRRPQRETLFAVHLIPRTRGDIHVGDPVTARSAG